MSQLPFPPDPPRIPPQPRPAPPSREARHLALLIARVQEAVEGYGPPLPQEIEAATVLLVEPLPEEFAPAARGLSLQLLEDRPPDEEALSAFGACQRFADDVLLSLPMAEQMPRVYDPAEGWLRGWAQWHARMIFKWNSMLPNLPSWAYQQLADQEPRLPPYEHWSELLRRSPEPWYRWVGEGCPQEDE